MNKNLTLVIMAAGMGSRFGGLKQIEPVGPNGEFIIDYDIYDAVLSGFKKVVFVIKEENLEIFKETIGKRIEKFVEVSYAFQKTDDIPSKYLPISRTKPWGTGQAILCAKDFVEGNFVIINADDYYGRDAFKVASDFIKNSTKGNWGMVGYHVGNTITLNGSVKRGVCTSKDGYLTGIDESTIERRDNNIIATSLNTNKENILTDNTLVSMNLLCFTNEIFSVLKEEFDSFLEENNASETKEFLIPNVVFSSIKKNIATVKVLETTSKWYGVTYKEDKEEVVNAIGKMIKEGIYPDELWK